MHDVYKIKLTLKKRNYYLKNKYAGFQISSFFPMPKHVI